ncbi:MAG: peptidylprolyl isomerase [Bryobacteraceae bacterium]|jgi:peptidyl-prolyl cis-trans isomerase A (cyclophilin A)
MNLKTLTLLTALAPILLAQASLMNPASLNEQAPATFKAKFATTAGDFTVQVTRAWSPIGADRFYNLVKSGFFTDESFFRIVPGFIVQFGIPADPKVAAVWQNANVKDDPFKQSNAAGTLVFARTSAPNSRCTQFFINLADNARSLDPQAQPGFTPFGKVTEGMNVVQKLYSGYGERPDQVAIQSQGKAYLDKNFPKLDSIKSATIVP